MDWEGCIGEEEGRLVREREAAGPKEEGGAGGGGGGGGGGRPLVMVT